MTNEMEKRDSVSKVKIKALLENKTDCQKYNVETIGIYDQNRILYQDEEIQMTLLISDKIHMKRTQKDAVLQIDFAYPLTTDGIYDIKSVNVQFHVKICTKKLVIEEQKIEIEYEMTLENEQPKQFYYQLQYEVIS